MKIALVFTLLFIETFGFGQTKTEINILLDSLAKTSNSKELSKSTFFTKIASYEKKALPILATFFETSEISQTFSECNERKITKGEIAIIVADQIKRMPYALLTGIQNCTLTFCDKNPNLIEYYLNDIKRNGNLVFIKKYKDWLNNNDFRQNR